MRYYYYIDAIGWRRPSVNWYEDNEFNDWVIFLNSNKHLFDIVDHVEDLKTAKKPLIVTKMFESGPFVCGIFWRESVVYEQIVRSDFDNVETYVKNEKYEWYDDCKDNCNTCKDECKDTFTCKDTSIFAERYNDVYNRIVNLTGEKERMFEWCLEE